MKLNWFTKLFFAGVLGTYSLAALEQAVSAEMDLMSHRVANPELIKNQPLGLQYSISATLGSRDSEYYPSKNEDGWTFENQEQRYASAISSHSFTVNTGDAHLGLRLLSFGYGDEQATLPKALIKQSNNRLEYQRGDTVEWLINGPIGLQHGFTLQSPPEITKNDDTTLTLRLAIDSSHDTQVSEDGLSMSLVSESGETLLTYGGLIAFDSAGKSVPAQMQIDGQQLLLLVDDRSAVYPLTIDPVFLKKVSTLVEEEAEERSHWPFITLALSSDIAVLSVAGSQTPPLFSHDIYVFKKPTSGWSGATAAAAQLDFNNWGFSHSPLQVYIDGDSIFVPYMHIDVSFIPTCCEGIFIYEKPARGWEGLIERSATILSPFEPTDSDIRGPRPIGTHLDVQNDVLAVYTRDAESPLGQFIYGDKNEAYIYLKPQSGWRDDLKPTARLEVGQTEASAISVGRNGTVIAIGFAEDTVNGEDSGSVSVYQKPASGWPESLAPVTKLVPSDGDANDAFGASIDVGNDAILVGAPYDEAMGDVAGSAYLFERLPTGWAANSIFESARLRASDITRNKRLGTSAQFCDDDLILLKGGKQDPSKAYDDSRLSDRTREASALIYYRPRAGWRGGIVESATIKQPSGDQPTLIGSSMACNHEYLLTVNQQSASIFSLQRPVVPAPILDLLLKE